MESSKTWRTEALMSFAINKSGMQEAKDVWTGRPDTPSEGGGTWAVAGCRNDVARFAHFIQWSGQHIRIGYIIVRVWCSRVQCASPWGSPDRGAHHVSSWGIRMEFLRIAMRAPCHQGEGPLHLAHADGPPCDIAHSTLGKNSVRLTFHLLRISHIWMGEESVSTSPIRHVRIIWSNISHPAPDAGWERRMFQLFRSDMSGSSDNAYPESFSLSIQYCSVLLKLHDISDQLFEIFCFRYLMSKSPNSPCNPPIIGFLSL